MLDSRASRQPRRSHDRIAPGVIFRRRERCRGHHLPCSAAEGDGRFSKGRRKRLILLDLFICVGLWRKSAASSQLDDTLEHKLRRSGERHIGESVALFLEAHLQFITAFDQNGDGRLGAFHHSENQSTCDHTRAARQRFVLNAARAAQLIEAGSCSTELVSGDGRRPKARS